MQVDNCSFPEDLFYDKDNDTWIRIDSASKVAVGINSLLSAIIGKINFVKLKPIDVQVRRGQSLGTIESFKFLGPIPAPISGKILQINENLKVRPKLVNDFPYDLGWIAVLEPSHFNEERTNLLNINQYVPFIRPKIEQFHVKCFKAYPDREMYEIGTECSAVLVRLNEMVASISVGEVIHLVTDDPTSYVELEVWKDKTGQELVEWRKENNLFHFILKKVL